jgi:hypothetical protein
VSISGQVRREFQQNPDFHVHSAKAYELTEEEYQKIYDEFLARYDVVCGEQHPLSMEAEAVE